MSEPDLYARESREIFVQQARMDGKLNLTLASLNSLNEKVTSQGTDRKAIDDDHEQRLRVVEDMSQRNQGVAHFALLVFNGLASVAMVVLMIMGYFK